MQQHTQQTSLKADYERVKWEKFLLIKKLTIAVQKKMNKHHWIQHKITALHQNERAKKVIRNKQSDSCSYLSKNFR